jgi:FkbH-like protein
MYREDRQRRAFQAEAASFSDFLTQLNLEVAIAGLRPQLLDRAVQLCQRTNQFNLTTRRHTAHELQTFADAPDRRVVLMNVRDRFGDYGWSGLAVARICGTMAEIETFLVSCRVLGKNVELALFDDIAVWARQRGCTHLRGRFIPTAKNALCAEFYPKCGLKPMPDDAQLFSSPLASFPPQPIGHIKLSHE